MRTTTLQQSGYLDQTSTFVSTQDLLSNQVNWVVQPATVGAAPYAPYANFKNNLVLMMSQAATMTDVEPAAPCIGIGNP